MRAVSPLSAWRAQYTNRSVQVSTADALAFALRMTHDHRNPQLTMTSPATEAEPNERPRTVMADLDVDVLIVGAGITGIYQLYSALEAGFSARLVEAGDGVG